jgi:hypothetical protein
MTGTSALCYNNNIILIIIIIILHTVRYPVQFVALLRLLKCLLFPEFVPVLRIRIRRIHMFLDLPEPNPDPLVTSSWLFILEKWCKCAFRRYGNKQKKIYWLSWRSLTKIAGSESASGSVSGSGSGSESINQKYGSADPDPDPYQNFMDPQHWFIPSVHSFPFYK